MVAENPKTYVSLSTTQLEDLLRRPDTPAKNQQLIRDELTRRYTDELLRKERGERGTEQQPRQGPVGPAAPVAGRPLTPPPPLPPRDAPPPLPPRDARNTGTPGASTKSSGSELGGLLIVVLIILVIGLVFVIYDFGNTPDPALGTVCVVYGGNFCQLPVSLPLGSFCTCTPDGVSQFPGSVVR